MLSKHQERPEKANYLAPAKAGAQAIRRIPACAEQDERSE